MKNIFLSILLLNTIFLSSCSKDSENILVEKKVIIRDTITILDSLDISLEEIRAKSNDLIKNGLKGKIISREIYSYNNYFILDKEINTPIVNSNFNKVVREEYSNGFITKSTTSYSFPIIEVSTNRSWSLIKILGFEFRPRYITTIEERDSKNRIVRSIFEDKYEELMVQTNFGTFQLSSLIGSFQNLKEGEEVPASGLIEKHYIETIHHIFTKNEYSYDDENYKANCIISISNDGKEYSNTIREEFGLDKYFQINTNILFNSYRINNEKNAPSRKSNNEIMNKQRFIEKDEQGNEILSYYYDGEYCSGYQRTVYTYTE